MKPLPRVRTTAKAVMDRLTTIRNMYYDTFDKIDYAEMAKMKRHFSYCNTQVEELLNEGWYGEEIVAFLKNLKEINPHQPADIAIANMRFVRDTVCRRFGLPLSSRQV